MERKINYPDQINNNPLEGIFRLQKGLLQHYIKIEGMPMYPINVQEKNAQKLIKEFIRRGIEELSEAHDKYQQLYLLSEKAPDIEPDDLLNTVLDFNEEISDALHFFIEALIYCNINGPDLDNYYQGIYRELNWDPKRIQPLQKMVEYARFSLQMDNKDVSGIGYPTFDLVGSELFYRVAGAKVISKTLVIEQAELMWDVTHNFMKACNMLKNNAWKQTEVETNVDKFQQQMAIGWVALINLLIHCGLNSEGVYLIYCHKNIINQKRITDKR